MALHSLQLVFQPNCNYPKFTVAVIVPQYVFLFFLFYDFYRKTYTGGVAGPSAGPSAGIESSRVERSRVERSRVESSRVDDKSVSGPETPRTTRT